VLERDDGVCHNTVQLEFFGGEGPAKVATCKPNEVEIPEVIGQSLASAKSRLQAQPLTPVVVYKPAKRAERLGVVVAQFPSKGTASAGDRVTIVLAKSTHGLVPNVVGLTLDQARTKLERMKIEVQTTGDSDGKVTAQSVAPRRAAAPGLEITLTVKGTGD
jgi:beta-lactam-binding protein with PASTA domain